MSNATSLYRRHRPRSFADLVGQDTVVRTLRHAVERDKVHHAYLFVGSRGTGKTSMAKILAACLNCENGPTTEPCGVCDSCRSIANATSLDVIEMDAASNNSVDDIRELRESVAFAPVSGRHKVYILDEAHMLSTAAWNAFLKTLEEPPPNTVFVLATTEAQKVPATVIDRCHRFDFQRPTVEQIATVLRRAAAAESIEMPAAAVAAISRSATGSFRDALGTLEQLVTYSGNQIALEDVLAVLGVADAELLDEAFDAVASGNASRALLAIHRCVESGHDAAAFASDLETRARELLVVQTLGSVPEELSTTPEADAALMASAQTVSRAAVVRVLELLASGREATRAGSDPRTQLELALTKAAAPELDGSSRALLVRIERLEAALAAATSGQPGLAPAAAVAAPPALAPASERQPSTGQASSAPAVASNGEEPPPVLAGAEESTPAGQLPPEQPPAVAPAAEQPPVAPSAPERREPLVAAVAAGPVIAVAAVAGASADGSGSFDVERLESLWPAVLDTVREQNAMLAALIADAHPVALAGEDLTVAFAASAAFLKRKAEHQDNRRVVADALAVVTGRRMRLVYELSEEDAGVDGSGVAAVPTEEEWVARFMDEFDAEELTVPPPEGE